MHFSHNIEHCFNSTFALFNKVITHGMRIHNSNPFKVPRFLHAILFRLCSIQSLWVTPCLKISLQFTVNKQQIPIRKWAATKADSFMTRARRSRSSARLRRRNCATLDKLSGSLHKRPTKRYYALDTACLFIYLRFLALEGVDQKSKERKRGFERIKKKANIRYGPLYLVRAAGSSLRFPP